MSLVSNILLKINKKLGYTTLALISQPRVYIQLTENKLVVITLKKAKKQIIMLDKQERELDTGCFHSNRIYNIPLL